MSTKKIKPNSSRREFFKKSIIAAGLLGIGCYRVSAESKKEIKALTESRNVLLKQESRDTVQIIVEN